MACGQRRSAPLLGHESPAITLRLYTHPLAGRTERIMKAFADDPATLAYLSPTKPGKPDNDNQEVTNGR